MKPSRGRPPSEKDADFVHTWDDLAFRLEITRRCLTKWREKFKDEPDFPRSRGDRHNVAAWLKFKANHNLGHAPAEQAEDDGEPSKAYYDKHRARVGLEREAYNFEVEKEKHLRIDEITVAIGQMLVGFRTALNNLPGSAARWVIGLTDFHAIKDKLQEEVDAVLQALGRCDYLENVTADVVAKTFPDRDDAFRAQIIQAADSLAREIGRRTLSDLLQRTLPQPESHSASHPSDAEHKDIGIDQSEPSRRQSNPSSKQDTSQHKRRKRK